MGSASSVIAALLVVVAVVLLAPPTPAVSASTVGGTAGYWRHHLDVWPEITPDQAFCSLFDGACGQVAQLTVLQALKARGGRGVEGASRALARAAAAAWLNAAHHDVGYPWRRDGFGRGGRPGLVTVVNVAFANGDETTMLALAAWLDHDSNRVARRQR